MSDKTVPLSRELLLRVLEPVTSEGYINAKHELVELMDAALAEPVPPAGGEVEVLAWLYDDGEGVRGVTDRWDVAKHVPTVCAQLVDRAHVTRLQAEVRRMLQTAGMYQTKWSEAKSEVERLKQVAIDRKNELTGMCTQVVDLQAELTKAREALQELFSTMLEYFPEDNPSGHEAMMNRAAKVLDSQSAPTAKDEPNDCAHSEASKHGCPECGEEFKP